MKNYLAPLEGITNHIYRNAYHKYFYPMDKYFTPFISAKPGKRLSRKEIFEVDPLYSPGLKVIPQILTNNAEDFIQTARIFQKEYGHEEVNLNLGCPSGTVTAKGKGAGFLGEPEKLRRFLDRIYSSLDMKISIKTRVGTDYEEDWEYLLDIYEAFPVYELIIHPRILKDYYKYTPRYQCFDQAAGRLACPLCYNGDIFTPQDYFRVTEQHPGMTAVMFGRGVITSPFLLSEICEGKGGTKKTLRAFHDEILDGYVRILSGDRNVLFRMKELWSYMGSQFSNPDKYVKKMKKAGSIAEYQAVVNRLFEEQELVAPGDENTGAESEGKDE